MVIAKDASNCITNSQSITITVNPALSIIVSPNDTICEGESSILNVTASGGNGGPYLFTWSNSTSSLNSISVSPIVSTNYVVQVNDGCSSLTSNIVRVTVNPLPLVDFSINPFEGCVPLKVTFNNLINAGNNSQYNWSFGDNTYASGTSQMHTYTQDGNYDINLSITSPEGCLNSLTKNNGVKVYNVPIANFTANPWVGSLSNPTIEFTDLSAGASFWWWNFDGSLNNSILQNPSHIYSDTGHFQVTLIVTNIHNCKDTAYGEVIIEGAFTFYIPNSFTPNGDGLNDYFEAKGVGIKSEELTIFDRWGKQFYFEKGFSPKWRGMDQLNNIPCQEDAYVYQIEVTDIFGKKHEFYGVVILER